MPETSTKPYMIRAIYEWCTDNGFTPYIAVFVDANTTVPREFVKNNEIVLNVSFDATSGLDMGNEWIHFSARFGGVSRKIEVPVDNVLAIYARENGQGMAFPVERSIPETQGATEREMDPPPKLAPVESASAEVAADSKPTDDDPNPPTVPRIGGKKPSLKVVK
jgi:stringent starvation protein B